MSACMFFADPPPTLIYILSLHDALPILPPEPDRGLHPVEPVRREPVVAVRFTPPEGLRPAEARWLWRKQLGSNAVAATLVDLAVRGFLTIQSADTDSRGRPRAWILGRTDPQKARAAQLLARSDE